MIKCALDEDGCIDLLAVLRIMNQISQEQAWALAYELAALMQRMWPAGNNCAIIESLAQIYIHQEGFVHEKSLWTKITSIEPTPATVPTKTTTTIAKPKLSVQDQKQNSLNKQQRNTTTAKLPPTPPISPELNDEILRRRIATSEGELISSLGMALFWALDYGIPDDEERKLNIAMEYLIVQSQKEMNLEELEQICIKRLPVAKKSQADQHYRQVCKSLIQDTIELSIFLDKIYTATMALSGVNGQQFHLHQLQAAISRANGQNNNNHQESKLANGHDYLRIAQQLANEKTTTNKTMTTVINKTDSIISDQEVESVKNCRDSLITFRNHFVDDDELSELGLPLASLRALKINDWARLWMQVIRELRQRGKIIAT